MATILAKWDTEELYANYIAPVLESNVALIPGLTTNANVQEINASAAVYYVQADASVTSGDAGRDFVDNEAGNTRAVVPLNKSLQVAEKMPRIVAETTPTEFVGRFLTNSTIKAMNRWGFLGLAALVNEGTHKTGTATTKDTIYGDIVDKVAAFDGANAEKGGATAIIVGPSALAKLRKSSEFAMNPSLSATTVQDGLVGYVAGLPVVYAKNLDSIAASDLSGYSAISGLDYIILRSEAFLAPKIYTYFDIIEKSEKFPGSKLIGEIPYGFEVSNPDMVYVRVTSSTAA